MVSKWRNSYAIPLPNSFYFDRVSGLGFDDKPIYELLRGIFREKMKEKEKGNKTKTKIKQ